MSRRFLGLLAAVSLLGVAAGIADAAVSAAGAAGSQARRYVVHWVPFEGHRLYVRDYPGRGPAFVLMHGFPDNLHLYDRVVPYLRGHHTVTFDFLGFGRSDKPGGHRYTFAEQQAELDAVVRTLGLRSIVPVVHDASGPAGINWSLAHPSQVAALVVLNTFYSAMPTLNGPQVIRIYSDPVFAPLVHAIQASKQVDHWLFDWQVGQFMTNPSTRRQWLRQMWPQFHASQPAFTSLNKDLDATVIADTKRVSEVKRFSRPVRIIFGGRDPYLNRGVARSFHHLFPTSQLFLLPARHYVQVDDPAQVARLLLSTPLAAASTAIGVGRTHQER